MRPPRMSNVVDLVAPHPPLRPLDVMRIQLSSRAMFTPLLLFKVNSKEPPRRPSTLQTYASAKTKPSTPTRRTTSVRYVLILLGSILRRLLQDCSDINSFLCAKHADNGSLRRILRKMGGRDMCMDALVLTLLMRTGESCVLIVGSRPL